MPETRTYTVYTYDELSESAQARARDWWRESTNTAGDNYYAESVIEDAARMADILGIDLRQRRVTLMGGGHRMEPAVYWSGFSHQGQGACFEGRYRYVKGALANIRKEAPADWTNADGSIGHSDSNARLHTIADTLQTVQRRYFYQLYADVTHRGHGVHEMSTEISVDADPIGDRYQTVSDEDVETVKDALRDFMRWIYRQLEKEYDYQMSDEVVAETIRANDYTFTEDGHRED